MLTCVCYSRINLKQIKNYQRWLKADGLTHLYFSFDVVHNCKATFKNYNQLTNKTKSLWKLLFMIIGLKLQVNEMPQQILALEYKSSLTSFTEHPHILWLEATSSNVVISILNIFMPCLYVSLNCSRQHLTVYLNYICMYSRTAQLTVTSVYEAVETFFICSMCLSKS